MVTFLVQLQTLGGECDEDVRSLGRRGRKVDKFVLMTIKSHMIT